MATPTIPNGKEQFFAILYEGNGKGQKVGKFVPFTDDGTIANSCIIDNTGATSQTLSATAGASPTSTQKFTLSFWIKLNTLGATQTPIALASVGSPHTQRPVVNFTSSNQFQWVTSGGVQVNVKTNRTFEDTSKWYHVLIRIDTTQGGNDNNRIYIDGDQQALTHTQDAGDNSNYVLASQPQAIGATTATAQKFTGYLAEINYVDGQSLGPDTFGVTDTSTGRWVPKALSGITYGTNGFRLAFGTGSAMGDDTANSNDFTPNNIDATNQTTDSPTQNFATLQGTGGTLSEGNLTLVTGNSEFAHHNATFKPKSGKYYAEFTCNAMGRSEVGVVSTLNVPYSSNTTRLPTTSDGSVAGYMYYGYNGQVRYDSSNNYDVTYATYTTNDIISIALDLDNHTVEFFKTEYDSGTSSYGSRVSQGTIGLPNGNYTFCMGDGATGHSGGWTANFGQKSLQHTPPTGFVALQQDNLPTTSKGVSGLVWTKNRDASDDHQLYDSLRGKQLRVTTDSTAVEATVIEGVQKFLKGGHSIGSDDAINTSGETFITWNWTGNGGTSVTNDASATGVGDIDSVYQANTTAGFSIVTYTGTGSNGTIAHGLGSKPHWVMSKPRDNSSDGFSVLHNSLGTNFLDLETNALPNTNTVVWNSVPTPTVFGVGTATGTNSSGVKYIAYCWSPIEGFSKFGSYTGNASSSGDGTFVYTGFRPAWLMVKRASGTTGNWVIMDSTRSPTNPVATFFNADGKSEVDTAARQTDFLSNGFKLRGNNAATNASATYIYFAFAEHPFVGDGTSPVTAR